LRDDGARLLCIYCFLPRRALQGFFVLSSDGARGVRVRIQLYTAPRLFFCVRAAVRF